MRDPGEGSCSVSGRVAWAGGNCFHEDAGEVRQDWPRRFSISSAIWSASETAASLMTTVVVPWTRCQRQPSGMVVTARTPGSRLDGTNAETYPRHHPGSRWAASPVPAVLLPWLASPSHTALGANRPMPPPGRGMHDAAEGWTRRRSGTASMARVEHAYRHHVIAVGFFMLSGMCPEEWSTAIPTGAAKDCAVPQWRELETGPIRFFRTGWGHAKP